jgi:hypothetical protein
MADTTAQVNQQPYRTYNYDQNIELIEIIDENGNSITFSSADGPQNIVYSYTHDSSGRLVQIQDAESTLTLIYVYDDFIDEEATDAPPSPSIT